MSTPKRYVLCKVSPGWRVFVGGPDPRLATFHRDEPEQAQRFASAEEAMDYRGRMRRQLCGDAEPCGVYELTPEGQLISTGV
jgi:hypothetical protein